MGAVVRRYIDILIIIINFPYFTCISSFLGQQHPYFFVHFLNVFSFLFYIIFVQYIANSVKKNIQDNSKIKITRM